MVPPPGAVNWSNTAYENARIVREAFKAMTAAFGAVGGGPTGAAGAMVTSSAVGGAKNALAGRALLSPTGSASRPVGAAALGIQGGQVGAVAGPKVSELFGFGEPQQGPLRLDIPEQL